MRVLQTEKMREGEQERSKSKLVQELIIQVIYAPCFIEDSILFIVLFFNIIQYSIILLKKKIGSPLPLHHFCNFFPSAFLQHPPARSSAIFPPPSLPPPPTHTHTHSHPLLQSLTL